MNTGTNLRDMDAETIASNLFQMNKHREVMQALLAQVGVPEARPCYGAYLQTIDYLPGEVKLTVNLHNREDCRFFKPGMIVDVGVRDQSQPWELGSPNYMRKIRDTIAEPPIFADIPIVENPHMPADEVHLRSGDQVVIGKFKRAVEHCEECGGPDVYHQLTCSKVRDLP